MPVIPREIGITSHMVDNSLLLDEAHRRCTFNYALHPRTRLKWSQYQQVATW